MSYDPDQVAQLQQALKTTCHPLVAGIDNAYHYRPSLTAGIVFLVFFGLSMLVHVAQSIWKRTWWTLVFAVGCLSE